MNEPTPPAGQPTSTGDAAAVEPGQGTGVPKSALELRVEAMERSAALLQRVEAAELVFGRIQAAPAGEGGRWLGIGYAALGLLVGALAGLSSSEVVNGLLTAVFAFMGGGVAFVVRRLDGAQLALAGRGLAAFALAALLGVVGGIVLKENRYLTVLARQELLRGEVTPSAPSPSAPSPSAPPALDAVSAAPAPYLKHASADLLGLAENLRVNGQCEAAYQVLREALEAP